MAVQGSNKALDLITKEYNLYVSEQGMPPTVGVLGDDIFRAYKDQLKTLTRLSLDPRPPLPLQSLAFKSTLIASTLHPGWEIRFGGFKNG